MRKILICSDSFGTTDPKCPGFSWSEKLSKLAPDLQIFNASRGGASNALIATQLMTGLNINPDFVILSFTSEARYEVDTYANIVPNDQTPQSYIDFISSRYRCTNERVDILDQLSSNLEAIKNYFYIVFCLETLKQKQIKFCFSLGGFEYRNDYAALLEKNYIENLIPNYKQHMIRLNLWNHMGRNPIEPNFHVDNEKIHVVFADECFSHLNKTHA